MLSEECKERQKMHNERCIHHCVCKKFETLLQVTEDVCRYAGIVMANNNILSTAGHTDQDIKIKDQKKNIETEIIVNKNQELIINYWVRQLMYETNSLKKSMEKEEKMNKYIAELDKENKEEKRKANNTIESLKEKLFQAKNINIDKIINRQNDRHKENAEQKLKEKEIQHKELEKRQNIKSATFCNFCELYQNFSGHYCHLLKCYIRIDTANLVLLKGNTLEQVEAIAKDGKENGTAIVETYPTKTRMYQKTEELKSKEKEKKMAEENQKKMDEEEEKKKEKENKEREEEMEAEQKKKEEKEKEWKLSDMSAEMNWKKQKWEEERKMMREKWEEEKEMMKKRLEWEKQMKERERREREKWRTKHRKT